MLGAHISMPFFFMRRQGLGVRADALARPVLETRELPAAATSMMAWIFSLGCLEMGTMPVQVLVHKAHRQEDTGGGRDWPAAPRPAAPGGHSR